MCFGMNVNKWAPKLVIVLQLATWTIVGLILLQRGVSSLRTPLPRSSRAIRTQVSISAITNISAEYDNDFQNKRKEYDFREEWNLESRPRGTTLAESSRKDMRSIQERERVHVNGSLAEPNGNSEQVKPKPGLSQNRTAETLKPLGFDESVVNENGTLTISTEVTERFGRKQTKHRELGPTGRHVAHVGHGAPGAASGAAAAAAVAMLVIGVVMLVLGPAIVILRALEGRRRARRLTKSRARKDLPPSYEQATLMDEAPRYSTLHLNAAPDSLLLPGCSSASASTTTAVLQTREASPND